ncbi:MAG: TolC family protein [Calditerrivibrio sp.]|nr:TolC family protein [Calditerrivibrio sp.]
MRRCFSLFLFLFFSINTKAETITNLKQAINISLEKNPQILAIKEQTDVYKHKIKQTEATKAPQINLSTGYSRVSPLPAVTTSKDTTDNYDLYTINLDLKMNLYDFKKTDYQIKSLKSQENSVVFDTIALKNNIAFQVTYNYFKLLQLKEQLNVAIQTLENQKKHLNTAKAFFMQGLKPKIDITKAEVNLSNAELNVIKATNMVKLATTELSKAIGVDNLIFAPEEKDFPLKDIKDLQAYLLEGYNRRWEIKSIQEKINALRESIKASMSNNLPTLNLESSYSRSGSHLDMNKDGWSIGFKVSIPLYNGNITNYQINELLSNITIYNHQLEQLKQNIRYEIENSYYSLVEAMEKYKISEKLLKQAEENYEIAVGRYNAGLSTPLELSDAEVELEKAKLNKISSKYEYLISKAMLSKAVGDMYE